MKTVIYGVEVDNSFGADHTPKPSIIVAAESYTFAQRSAGAEDSEFLEYSPARDGEYGMLEVSLRHYYGHMTDIRHKIFVSESLAETIIDSGLYSVELIHGGYGCDSRAVLKISNSDFYKLVAGHTATFSESELKNLKGALL